MAHAREALTSMKPRAGKSRSLVSGEKQEGWEGGRACPPRGKGVGGIVVQRVLPSTLEGGVSWHRELLGQPQGDLSDHGSQGWREGNRAGHGQLLGNLTQITQLL